MQSAEHIGTKTAVQIRSHAQKFFSKLEREQAAGNTSGTAPPPPFFGVVFLAPPKGAQALASLLAPSVTSPEESAQRSAKHSARAEVSFEEGLNSEGYGWYSNLTVDPSAVQCCRRI